MTRPRLAAPRQAWAWITLLLLVRLFADGVLGRADDGPCRLTPVRIDVNRATVAELTVLPGFGRARAEALVLERVRRGPFRALADLARVDGLGPVHVAAAAPWLHFGDGAPP